VVPAQRAEGASDSPLPLNSFFVAPNVWTKFSIRHPGVSYSKFLSYRVERYRLHNEAAKHFFADFSKDPTLRSETRADRGGGPRTARICVFDSLDSLVAAEAEPE
jgi:hypothetical protein